MTNDVPCYVIVNPVVVLASTAPPAKEYWVRYKDHERIVAELNEKISDLEVNLAYSRCRQYDRGSY